MPKDKLLVLEIVFFILTLISLVVFPERVLDRFSAYTVASILSLITAILTVQKVRKKHWPSIGLLVISLIIFILMLLLLTMRQT